MNELERHAEVMKCLGEIKGELKALRPTIARQRRDHELLEMRTRVLEGWRWYLTGLFTLSLLGSIAAYILG